MRYYTFIALLLAVIIMCKGCSNSKNTDMEDKKEIQKTILSLGDSYTIGESVEEGERYPVQLKKRLDSNDIKIILLDIVARTGWTTDELQNGINNTALNETYDLVTLLIGVNNQYRGRDTANYRAEFKILLDTAISKAGNNPSHVIVISIPDWGVTPFAENRDRELIAREIDAFNAINLEESQKIGVRYVDITAISRQAATDTTLIASDGLHPSAKMYRLWVDKIFPVAYEMLND